MTQTRGVKFELTLDRPRTFAINMGVIEKVERITGQSFLRGQLGVSDVNALLFAGNQTQPRLKLPMMHNLVEDAGWRNVFSVVTDAISEYLGDDGEASLEGGDDAGLGESMSSSTASGSTPPTTSAAPPAQTTSENDGQSGVASHTAPST